MSNLKREYLNAEEKNFYMVSKAFIQMLNGERNLENKITDEIWVEWQKRGMITPGMQKNIKLVHTYLKKFCYELEENLSESELKRLNKQLEKFDYKLIDDYTVKKILRDIKDHIRYAIIDREKFEPVLEDIAAVRCCGCTTDYRECAIYKMLDDISIPYLGEQLNCPYAADLAECTEKQLEHIEELKKKINGKNKVGVPYVSNKNC
jgi:hypothetical protein